MSKKRRRLTTRSTRPTKRNRNISGQLITATKIAVAVYLVKKGQPVAAAEVITSLLRNRRW